MTSRSSGPATSPVRAGASTRTSAAIGIFGAMARPRTRLLPVQRRHVYADGPLAADGRAARRDRPGATSSPPEKSKVAETLAEFRGQYAYNLIDENAARVRRAGARRSTSGTTTRSSTTGTRARSSIDARYTEKRVDVLAAARAPGVRRVAADHPEGADRGTVHRKLSYGPLLDVFVARHAHLQGPQRRQPSTPTRSAASSAPSSSSGSSAGSRARRPRGRCIAIDLPLGLIVPDGAAPRRASPRATPAPRSAASCSSRDLLRDAHRQRRRPASCC